MFVALSLLSGIVDFSGHLVEVSGGVHILPEGLSVSWVVATSVGLLRSIVVEWDTLSSQSEHKSSSEHIWVIVLIQESGVVVVVNEDTKSIKVLEMTLLLLPSSRDLLHRLLSSEHVLDGIVHWVVEKPSDMILIRTDISWVTIEAFSHLEHSRSLSKLAPEVFWDLRDGINSNTIEAEVSDEALDPVFKVTSDVVVFLSKIRKTSESAVLNLLLVAPVIDITISVVVLLLVQRVNLGKVVTDWSDVVGNNIDHHVNSFIVASLDQVLEVIVRSKV